MATKRIPSISQLFHEFSQSSMHSEPFPLNNTDSTSQFNDRKLSLFSDFHSMSDLFKIDNSLGIEKTNLTGISEDDNNVFSRKSSTFDSSAINFSSFFNQSRPCAHSPNNNNSPQNEDNLHFDSFKLSSIKKLEEEKPKDVDDLLVTNTKPPLLPQLHICDVNEEVSTTSSGTSFTNSTASFNTKNQIITSFDSTEEETKRKEEVNNYINNNSICYNVSNNTAQQSSSNIFLSLFMKEISKMQQNRNSCNIYKDNTKNSSIINYSNNHNATCVTNSSVTPQQVPTIKVQKTKENNNQIISKPKKMKNKLSPAVNNMVISDNIDNKPITNINNHKQRMNEMSVRFIYLLFQPIVNTVLGFLNDIDEEERRERKLLKKQQKLLKGNKTEESSVDQEEEEKTKEEINDNKKRKIIRGLVLGSGGDHGAYEVGVLKYLAEKRPNEMNYQVVAGNSVGAINAAFICQHNIGEEKAAVDELVDKWLNLTAEDVYKNWPYWFFEGLFKSGLYSTTPLENYLSKNYDFDKFKNSDREFLLGLTKLKDFSYYSKSKAEIDTKEELVQTIRAGAAVPGLFECVHVELDETHYVDGGIKYMAPVIEVIQKCLNIIYKEQQQKVSTSTEPKDYNFETDINMDDYEILIDVVLAVTPTTLPRFLTEMSIAPVILFRALYDFGTGLALKDVFTAQLIYQQAKHIKLRVFAPSSTLSDNSYFLFKPEAIKQMIEAGYKDAAQVCSDDENQENFMEVVKHGYKFKLHKNAKRLR
ncbi:hypothetical protein ABK040_004830 [Willaertia magna]